MKLLSLRPSTSLSLFLTVLLVTYLIWANTTRTISADGGWIADFNDPRQLVGAADAVFVGRVAEQVGVDETDTPFPQTQFRVEVVDTVKSVRRVNPQVFGSLPANPTVLPNVVVVDQYGAQFRDNLGRKTEVLMGGQHLLVPGQTYLFATAYDSEQNWYHVLPQGAVLLDRENGGTAVERFKKAKKEEIPLTLESLTRDGPPNPPANRP